MSDAWSDATRAALAKVAAIRAGGPADPTPPAPAATVEQGWDAGGESDLPSPEQAAHSRVALHLDKVAGTIGERAAQREIVKQKPATQQAKDVQIADMNRHDLYDLAKAERIMEVVQGASTNVGKATANLTTMIAERSSDLDEALEMVEKVKGTTVMDEFPVHLPLLRQNLEAIFGRNSGPWKRPPKLSPRLQELQRAQLEGKN